MIRVYNMWWVVAEWDYHTLQLAIIEDLIMNAIAIHRPGLLGHKVINEMFDSFFNDFPSHLKQSTQGYPVADIYRDDDGSTG